VAAEVDRGDAVPVPEMLDLPIPELLVAGPAVHKHHYRLTLALDPMMNRDRTAPSAASGARGKTTMARARQTMAKKPGLMVSSVWSVVSSSPSGVFRASAQARSARSD
jgi:hypothetical protein